MSFVGPARRTVVNACLLTFGGFLLLGSGDGRSAAATVPGDARG